MTSKLTRITLSCSLLTTTFFMPLAYAEGTNIDNKKTIVEQVQDIPDEEKYGISIGAIIGGIFGGPPGAILAAIAGDYIGKDIVADKEIAQLESSLDKKQQQLVNTQHKSNSELKQLEMQHQQEVLSIAASYENSEKAQVENILVSLMFRTGSTNIEPHYQQQVIALAAVLKRSPHLNIDLSGYTDKQGDEQLNQAIAQQRVDKVKALLVAQNIAEHRISTTAFGELEPVNANIASEVNYFDRRVVMKLKVDSEEVAKQANTTTLMK
ncbi:sortase-associated OmpA-like protein PdsO [Colwelliaceae bacterium BS250]